MRADPIQIFRESYRELRPRAVIPDLRVEFFPFANLNNTIRLRQGRLLVRLSDLLEGAPQPVLHAIAHILLAKLYRKPISAEHALRYRRFTAARPFSRRVHLVRHTRGRKTIVAANGHAYDLNAIFDDLNTRFFHGLLARPEMTWSRHRSRQSLGHYDPAHNTIVVSRIFDHPGVPRYAVEYLVFHEMLHLRHPVKVRGARRCFHSREFQAEEKQFPRLADARAFLKKL